MPRRSAVALSTVMPLMPEPTRLQPPSTLSPIQKKVWERTVAALPWDWFSAEQAPLLLEYCRQCERADQIEMMLAKADGVDEYTKLWRSGVLVGTHISNLARSMRL